jgi:hypothetical protein
MGADLVQVLLFIADDLEERGYAFSGAVRQGARRVAELEATMSVDAPNTSERCGKPLERRPTGRPRKWCSERCRRKVPQSPSFSEVSRRESA